jgi:RNA polymerase sigma factor (sigma-70 family)
VTSGLVYNFGESDEDLLRRCQDGDEAALRELLRRHERAVYGLLTRMLGSREDAEDALAEVFVKVWRSAKSFRGDAKFTTWLYRIAGNTARDFLRSRKARPEFPVDDVFLSETDLGGSDAVDPEKSVVDRDEVARIDRAMMRLSTEDRLLVTLYHIRELSLEEVAKITGQNRSNLKVKLFRARQKLRAHIEALDRERDNEMQAGTTESFGIQPGPPESASG